MKSLVRYLLAGVVSGFASVSAGGTASGNVLIAPQLEVATTGPVTATFLGGNQAFNFLVGITGMPFDGNRFSSFTFFTFPTSPGTQAQRVLPGGADITFMTIFTSPINGQEIGSMTGATARAGNIAVDTLFPGSPQEGAPPSGFPMLNAGVVDLGRDRVLIGFTPFPLFGSAPSGFGSFPVRISVSNVCIR